MGAVATIYETTGRSYNEWSPAVPDKEKKHRCWQQCVN